MASSEPGLLFWSLTLRSSGSAVQVWLQPHKVGPEGTVGDQEARPNRFCGTDGSSVLGTRQGLRLCFLAVLDSLSPTTPAILRVFRAPGLPRPPVDQASWSELPVGLEFEGRLVSLREGAPASSWR